MIPPSRRMTMQKRRPTGIMPRLHGCIHTIDFESTCHECAKACPTGCITFPEGRLHIESERCDGCEKCVAACPNADIPSPVKDPHATVKHLRELLDLDQVYER